MPAQQFAYELFWCADEGRKRAARPMVELLCTLFCFGGCSREHGHHAGDEERPPGPAIPGGIELASETPGGINVWESSYHQIGISRNAVAEIALPVITVDHDGPALHWARQIERTAHLEELAFVIDRMDAFRVGKDPARLVSDETRIFPTVP